VVLYVLERNRNQAKNTGVVAILSSVKSSVAVSNKTCQT